MPTPVAPVLDDFNSGALQLLTARAGWHASVLGAGDLSLRTDATPTYADGSNTPATAHSAVWGTSFSRDSEAWFTYTFVDEAYIFLRNPAPPTSSHGYAFHVRWNGVNNEILSPSLATLVTWTQTAPAAGDSYALQVQGTSVTAWTKRGAGAWTVSASVNDSSLLVGGYAAIFVPGSAITQIDKFAAGDIAQEAWGPRRRGMRR